MENETFVPEIDVALKLPQAGDCTLPSIPPIDDAVSQACARLAIDNDASQRIAQLLSDTGATTASDQLVEMLARALRHDEDVSNAEATGYLRGRNENIDEALASRHSHAPQPTTFPRYNKRSIWD